MLEKFDELESEIKNLIAEKPKDKRDHSKLMVVNRKSGDIDVYNFFSIIDHFKEGDCLVINQSRVWKANLPYRKKTGGKGNLLLISPLDKEKKIWRLLARKTKSQDEYMVGENTFTKCLERKDDGSFIFEFSESLTEEFLNRHAIVPLPSYIEKKRKQTNQNYDFESDINRYQTVYAKHTGSIAAPTAGFHFTEDLLTKIEKKGIVIAPVTLHIGWGTFKPIRAKPQEHIMDGETCIVDEISAEAVNKAKLSGNKVIAVGTSSVRTLEKMSTEKKILNSGRADAEIFIYPGYNFKIPDIFVTNFHVPSSPPLFMTAAFCGEELLYEAYKKAIEEKFRFYSYGDSMMII